MVCKRARENEGEESLYVLKSTCVLYFSINRINKE